MIFSSLINYSRQLAILYNSAALDTPPTDEADPGLLLVPLLYDAEVMLDLSRGHPTHFSFERSLCCGLHLYLALSIILGPTRMEMRMVKYQRVFQSPMMARAPLL